MRTSPLLIALAIALSPAAVLAKVGAGETATKTTKAAKVVKVPTRIGTLDFSHGFEVGYPSPASAQKLYDELDFQRATQLYLWAQPLVGMNDWARGTRDVFQAKDNEFVLYQSFDALQGILTPNTTTPYLIATADLARTGPLVWEFTGGLHAGAVLDAWQKSLTDVGPFGPDKSAPAKFLLIPPGSTQADVPGYISVRSTTNNVMYGTRALDPDPAKRAAFYANGMRVYPYAAANDATVVSQPVRIIDAGDKRWGGPIRGMEFWQLLHACLQNEVVLERDRQMMAMLKPLGIEKGKPFAPDARQRKLLLDGALVGEAMIKSMTFARRDPATRYRDDGQWHTVMNWHPSHETEHYHQLDEMAVYTYQAFATNKAMATRIPGIGQAYLEATRDSQGDWLDGSRAYVLRVPADVPAKQFWSLTAYDISTRALIDNPQKVAEKSSRLPLVKNADGSVDLYLAPDTKSVPQGKEANWIPTLRNRAFFAWFRLYAPTEPYLNREWHLPDLEPIARRQK